ncbi:MAG: hypothetical protein AB8G86_19985 [Saprospiraceae bacterium]
MGSRKVDLGRYIISGTTLFKQVDLTELFTHAPKVLEEYFPDYATIYTANDWTFFPSIGRVYVHEVAQKVLGWQPKYDFQWVLDCLKNNKDFRNPLAVAVSIRGYHEQTFEDGPYPV